MISFQDNYEPSLTNGFVSELLCCNRCRHVSNINVRHHGAKNTYSVSQSYLISLIKLHGDNLADWQQWFRLLFVSCICFVFIVLYRWFIPCNYKWKTNHGNHITLLCNYLGPNRVSSITNIIRALPVIRTRFSVCAVKPSMIARFMGPTCGPSGADRIKVDSMLASWTLLSGKLNILSCNEIAMSTEITVSLVSDWLYLYYTMSFSCGKVSVITPSLYQCPFGCPRDHICHPGPSFTNMV